MLHVYIGRAQDASQVVEVATAVCSFSDGKQITVQYNREFASSRRRTDNEVWMPGGSPMILCRRRFR
jgi:hypothetical protein